MRELGISHFLHDELGEILRSSLVSLFQNPEFLPGWVQQAYPRTAGRQAVWCGEDDSTSEC